MAILDYISGNYQVPVSGVPEFYNDVFNPNADAPDEGVFLAKEEQASKARLSKKLSSHVQLFSKKRFSKVRNNFLSSLKNVDIFSDISFPSITDLRKRDRKAFLELLDKFSERVEEVYRDYNNVFVPLFHNLIKEVFSAHVEDKNIFSLTSGFFCMLGICTSGPNAGLRALLLKDMQLLRPKEIAFCNNIFFKDNFFEKILDSFWEQKSQMGAGVFKYAYKVGDSWCRIEDKKILRKISKCLFSKFLNRFWGYFGSNVQNFSQERLELELLFPKDSTFSYNDLIFEIEGVQYFPREYVYLANDNKATDNEVRYNRFVPNLETVFNIDSKFLVYWDFDNGRYSMDGDFSLFLGKDSSRESFSDVKLPKLGLKVEEILTLIGQSEETPKLGLKTEGILTLIGQSEETPEPKLESVPELKTETVPILEPNVGEILTLERKPDTQVEASDFSLKNFGRKRTNEDASFLYADEFNITSTLESLIISSSDYYGRVCNFLEVLDEISFFTDIDFASYISDTNLSEKKFYALLNELSKCIGAQFKSLAKSCFYDGKLGFELASIRDGSFFKKHPEMIKPSDSVKERKWMEEHGVFYFRNLFVQLFHDLILENFYSKTDMAYISSLTKGFFNILEIFNNDPQKALYHLFIEDTDDLSSEALRFIKGLNINTSHFFKGTIRNAIAWERAWRTDKGLDGAFLNFAYNDRGIQRIVTNESLVRKIYMAIFEKIFKRPEWSFDFSWNYGIRSALDTAIIFDENVPFSYKDLTCEIDEITYFPVEYIVLFAGHDKNYIFQKYYPQSEPLVGHIEYNNIAKLIRYKKPITLDMKFYISCNFHIFWNTKFHKYEEREHFRINLAEAMRPDKAYIDKIFPKQTTNKHFDRKYTGYKKFKYNWWY